MITPAQSRAARALLGWRQTKLAEVAQVGERTIIDFEGARRATMTANVAAIQRAMEEAGIEFTLRGGVEPRTRT